MPAPEITARFQRAILWPFVRFDDFGEPVVGDPEDVLVRWEFKQIDIRKPDGTPISLDAVAVVTQDIKTHSRMWLAPDSAESAIDQWYGSGSAGAENEDVMEVVTFNRTPDVRARKTRRTVGLKRYRTVPES
jgi:hypothetical protein